LLERGVVFLVDDHHAEIGDWREHRRTRPQHDARFARDALPPGGEALGIGERGMKHRDRNGEPFAKSAHELRREPDLRHQYQGSAVATQGALHRVQKTSVLPLPVIPYNRKGAKRPCAASMASTA